MLRTLFLRLDVRLAGLVLGALVPIIAVIAGLTWQRANDERRLTEARLLHVAHLVGRLHDRSILDSRELLRSAALHPDLLDAERCGGYLRALSAAAEFDVFMLLDATGKLVCASQPAPPGASFADRSYYQRVLATEGFAIGDYLVGRVSGKPVLPLAWPILDAQDHLHRLLVAGRKLEWLSDLLVDQNDLPGLRLTVVDRAGRVLARAPSDSLTAGQPLPLPDLAAAIAAAPSGVLAGSDPQGERRLHAFTRVGPLIEGLTVIASMPQQAAAAATPRLMAPYLAAVLLPLGLSVTALVVGIHRDVLRPLRRLAAILAGVRGDREVIVALPGRVREWQETALAVEDMYRRLREHQAAYMALADLAPAGIFRSDLSGACEYVNDRWCAFAGMPAERALGDGWKAALHPDDRARVLAEWRAAIAQHRPFACQFRYRSPDGTVTWLLASSAEVTVGGTPRWIVATMQDITQIKTSEEELRRLIDELSRANGELEHFTRAASHDLQEPLRSIVSFSQLLERRYHDTLDDTGREFLALIANSARRMHQQINDVLVFSRASTVTGYDWIDLDVQLAEVLENLAGVIRETDARVTAGPLPRVYASRLHVRQLLQNLIGNAIKFARPGLPARVHVSAERHGKGWLFTVADNGIGFPPEQADRLFEPFVRLHAQHEVPGTGLGLALCRRIAEQHGGEIWATSQPGEGSRFFFTLPECCEVAAE